MFHPDLRTEDPLTVGHVIRAARKPSSCTLYTCKWNTVCRWASSHILPTIPTTLHTLLDFLLYLHKGHLSHSTLKVYISSIVAHPPVGSEASRLFRHPELKLFLKGIRNLRTLHRTPTPQWSLQLVHKQLMKPPFEPIASSSDRLPSLARRASEPAVLRVDPPPFLQFHPQKVTLFPDVSFLPKVVSEFHIM